MENEEVITFEQIGVQKWLVENLKKLAINKPTEIQALCIPSILQGNKIFKLQVKM